MAGMDNANTKQREAVATVEAGGEIPVRGFSWTIKSSGGGYNSIRTCCRCGNHRTFRYYHAGRTNSFRVAADGCAVLRQDDRAFSPPTSPELYCPKCGGAEKVCDVLKTRVTKRECNDKCMASTSGRCECSCGGKNHGMSYSA